MSSHPFFWLDVFAESPLAGNGLAVVLDADGVSDEIMLAFAREIYYSPTVRNITIPDDLKGKVLAGNDIAKMVDFDWTYINANRAAWQRKIDREIAG